MQKILYHLVADHRDWAEGKGNAAKVREAKKRCIEHIRSRCGFLIDTPSVQGGNTNCGPVADRFFCEKNRRQICDIIESEEDRNIYEGLLRKFNILLTITQKETDMNVDIQKVKVLGKDIMLLIKSFVNNDQEPWVNIVTSVHQLCAHSWELFKMNNGASVSKWSESPLEAWHKSVSSFSRGPACRARQCSVKLSCYYGGHLKDFDKKSVR